MKIFRCQSCSQVVYFENTQCMNCGAVLGFLPGQFLISSLDATGDDVWRPVAAAHLRGKQPQPQHGPA